MSQPAGRRYPDNRRAGWTAVAAATAAGLLAAGCAGAGAGHPVAGATSRATVPPTFQPAATPTPATRPSGSPTLIPLPPPGGRLPQTHASPSADTRAFGAEMTDLWAAVVTGRAALAARAFFPLAAYTQIKAIADPAADWHARLFGDFRLDVAAAHHYLGRHPARARLVRVIVPSADAAWISPGVCYNSGGYWHVGGARLVYRRNGQLRSIGIASLISWRGRWYVVHFGAVLRSAVVGIVDQPAVGPGVPGPAGGC